MVSRDLTAILQVYYPQRAKYLPRIIEALQQGSIAPTQIIIWCNRPIPESTKRILGPDGVSYITSQRNNLLGRYMAMLAAQTEFVFCQDDDLCVQPETVRALMEKTKETGRICGTSGVILNTASDHPYTEGRWVSEGHADVILGRCWAAPRSEFGLGLWRVLDGENPGRCDDIHFSMTSGGGYVVQGLEIKPIDLPEEGIGLCHEPQHFPERDAFALRLLRELAVK